MPSQDLNITQVAPRCNRSGYAVALWLKSGKLKGYKVGTGPRAAWRVTEEALQEFLSKTPRIHSASVTLPIKPGDLGGNPPPVVNTPEVTR
ncbi:MAG: hypothetical protein WA705_16895 [Candidatus Ozemobacteraceae bacterium]